MKLKIFLNASVVLAALGSRTGASAQLLRHYYQFIVSELVIDEVKRHLAKIEKTLPDLDHLIKSSHVEIIPAPSLASISRWNKIVIDPGDSHLLASCHRSHSDYLVSLDKKHILTLKALVSTFIITSPGELLQELRS